MIRTFPSRKMQTLSPSYTPSSAIPSWPPSGHPSSKISAHVVELELLRIKSGTALPNYVGTMAILGFDCMNARDLYLICV